MSYMVLETRRRSQLLGLGQGLDLLFESLIVLALDFQLGLELLDEQLEVRNFGAELSGIAARGTRRPGGRRVLLRRGWRSGTRGERFSERARPDGLGRLLFRLTYGRGERDRSRRRSKQIA